MNADVLFAPNRLAPYANMIEFTGFSWDRDNPVAVVHSPMPDDHRSDTSEISSDHCPPTESLTNEIEPHITPWMGKVESLKDLSRPFSVDRDDISISSSIFDNELCGRGLATLSSVHNSKTCHTLQLEDNPSLHTNPSVNMDHLKLGPSGKLLVVKSHFIILII
jgi:hypothetical protein